MAETSSIPDLRSFMRCSAMTIEHRGGDATGFAWSRPDGQGEYWKVPNTAYIATRTAPLPREATVILGHTRAGTGGSKTNPANNHPVVDDGIMLIHNGTLHNDYHIYRNLFDLPVPQNTVDTAAWALLLSHRDQIDKPHPTDVLSIPTGSAALAWIENDDPHALHLARTVERPLTIGWTRKGDLVMSSTSETLWHLSLMTNIKFRNVTEVEEGTYLRIVAGEIQETGCFEPKRYTYSSQAGGYSGTQGPISNNGSGNSLELVKNGGKVGEIVEKGECRWDVPDLDVPKDVPFDKVSIRLWRDECDCEWCIAFDKDLEREEILKEYETYDYGGGRMIWEPELGMWIPEAEFWEEYEWVYGETISAASRADSE